MRKFAFAPAEGDGEVQFLVCFMKASVFHQEAQVSRVSVTDKLGVSQVNR